MSSLSEDDVVQFLKVKKLPEAFSLTVKDDAMAPMLTKGTTAHFSTKRSPRVDWPVLVADRADRLYIRNYAQGRGDEWAAVASKAGYLPLESARDHLRLVAVLTGLDTPDD